MGSRRKTHYVHDILNRPGDYTFTDVYHENGKLIGRTVKFHKSILKLRGLCYNDKGEIVSNGPKGE